MDEPQSPHEPGPAIPVDAPLVTAAETEVPGLVEAPPEKIPFWDYSDVMIFAGMAIPSMLLGWAIVQGLIRLLHLRVTLQAGRAMPYCLSFWYSDLGLIPRMRDALRKLKSVNLHTSKIYRFSAASRTVRKGAG